METGKPVIISDTEQDARFTSRRSLSRSEGYRGMVSTPLTVDGEAIGTLNVYRAVATDWSPSDVDVLVLFAGAAANAIFTAQLLDRQGRQRPPSSGSCARCASRPTSTPTGSTRSAGCWRWASADEAGRFVMGVGLEHKGDAYDVEQRIAQPTVAGLILAESAIGRQRGIRVALTEDSSLSALRRRWSTRARC